MTVWVVKLGGSLANSDELPLWLDVIATQGAGKVVLVPGGGPWADEVRQAQKRDGFDDALAHRKALCAMEFFGRNLCAMCSGLTEAGNAQAIHDVLDNGRVAVWMPNDMVLGDASIPQTWDVTSDSLAAWLAAKLCAGLLVLVKSVSVVDPQTSIVEMTVRGWVDAGFEAFCARGHIQHRVLGRRDHQRLACMLAESAASTPMDVVAGSGR